MIMPLATHISIYLISCQILCLLSGIGSLKQGPGGQQDDCLHKRQSISSQYYGNASSTALRFVNPFTTVYPEEFVCFAKTTSGSTDAKAVVTDKVSTHSYQVMYGMFILPLVHGHRDSSRKIRLLEIGMGCDMFYGPGKSLAIWREMFRGLSVDIWMAEFDKECVASARAKGQLDGVHVLVGDQADRGTLQAWVAEATRDGHGFDVIIDDGGHTNLQIKNTFDVLFPQALNPGGLYFIEDLQVGRRSPWFDATNGLVMGDILQSWLDQLLSPRWNAYNSPGSQGHPDRLSMQQRFPLPAGLKWIFCQYEACVLSKCHPDLSGGCAPPITFAEDKPLRP